jgi:leader peptidase (prepilin peptidase) / N-methyltransferase
VKVVAAVAAGLLASAVGSFLNVVIHRVPRGESVVRPASRCPSCGTELRVLDNIPIVSWLVLRGRCRSCRAPISPRYPLIEAATSALWVGCVLRFETLEEAAFVALAATTLLALAAIDLEHRRLPNVIVLPGTIVAIAWVAVFAASEGETDVLLTALACGAAAFALFFLIALLSGGMGMGDVKLAGFIGVATGRFGWEVTVAAVFASFFIGGGLAIGLLLARRVGRKQAIPFGPSMAAGAVLALFAGSGPVQSWLGL